MTSPVIGSTALEKVITKKIIFGDNYLLLNWNYYYLIEFNNITIIPPKYVILRHNKYPIF